MKKHDTLTDLNRRDFLKGSSATTLMMLLGGVELKAAEQTQSGEAPTQYKTTGEPLKCAVIGLGARGRELLATLAKLPNAPVVAICDGYEAFLKRAKAAAPEAGTFTDYKQVLARKDVEGVLIATPTHTHKEIVLAALDSGKHVYCEAPLANTIDDVRTIAQAARNHLKVNFQAGLQGRAYPHHHFLLTFVRTGALGKNVKGRAQWHKKQSWRRTSPNPDRERELNWRLDNATSLGLVGEIGIHQIDLANWIINALPVSVTGFGGIVNWSDGRDVPDSVEVVFEYPGKVFLTYEASLATSFDGENNVFYGTDATLMVRQNKAWMFKEVDAPLLGWEVYAKKDAFYKDTGIVLMANATKLAAQGKQPGEEPADVKPALQDALEAFASNSKVYGAAVEDFAANFDVNDTAALKEAVDSAMKNKLHAAGYKEGLEATVSVIKANEAVLKGERIKFQKEWFEF
jgi:predicted dehydrogenase